MIRKNKHQHVPLYRDIVRESLLSAWHKPSLWILALFAAILQTGGTLDVILYSIKQMTLQGSAILQSPWLAILSSQSLLQGAQGIQGVFSTIGHIQAFLYSSLIVGAILVCSLLAQGALVYGLGGRARNTTPRLAECLAASGRHAWSIAALNVLTIGLIWLARFVLVVPFALSVQHLTVGSLILYVLAFLVFLFVSFLFTTVHLFALNSLLLNNLSLWQAIEHAYLKFKSAWLIIIETGVILLAIGFIVLVAACLLFLIAMIPLFLYMIGAALVQAGTLLMIGYALSLILFCVIMATAGAFMVCFQYDTWGRLYERVQEGTALAKLHRWYHMIKYHE